jgi:hypothetical protein
VFTATPIAAAHEPELAHGTPNVAGMGRTPPPATQGNAPDLRDGCALRLLACANLLSKRATALKSLLWRHHLEITHQQASYEGF